MLIETRGHLAKFYKLRPMTFCIINRDLPRAGPRARFRLGFRAGYDVFRMYDVLISTNQIRALKITSNGIDPLEAWERSF